MMKASCTISVKGRRSRFIRMRRAAEETFSLPVDPDLRDILRDIMKK